MAADNNIMQQRIGIFGGSFNPVHVGHLIMAQDACEHFGLQKLFLIPAANPPHKNHSGHLVAAEHRLAMLRLAAEPDPRFAVSEEEIRRGGVSYSIDTVRVMRAEHPDAALYFIIGSDTLFELHTWKDIGELLNLCEFATLARPGFSVDKLTAVNLGLPDPWPARLAANVMVGHLVEISSTDIRRRVARGLSIRYLVPEAVERYIVNMQLFREESPR